MQPTKPRLSLWKRCAAAAAMLLVLASCSSMPPDDPEERAAWEEANDPWEDVNRYVFEVNYAIDQLILRPIAGWYRIGVPEPLRDALRNAVNNARSPVIFMNDLLQMKPERAGVTLGRFLANTVLGLGGLIDVAKMMGLEFHDEDFGQTLAVWGIEEGWYMVLPLFGPSNPRDALGLAIDSAVDPVNWLFREFDLEAGPNARTVVSLLDFRSRAIDTLDELEKTSIDYYATMRSLYRQRRNDMIRDGEPAASQFAPTLSRDGQDEDGEQNATSPFLESTHGEQRADMNQ